MNYWWVNHKQTFKSEFEGGYIWAPKTKSKGSFNQAYYNLTLAKVGDIIFSYANTLIKAVGIIESNYTEESVPVEFGEKGNLWNTDGYMVKVKWTPLLIHFKPKNHMDTLQNLLPAKFSPIRNTGDGNQAFYLCEISRDFGIELLDLIQKENQTVLKTLEDLSSDLKDEKEETQIKTSNINPTEKAQLIKARRGQGTFRNRLITFEKGCRITGITDLVFLTASHIKPWRDSSNYEKLDGNNGLFLSPHLDRLFDKGWISFSDNGDIIIANSIAESVIVSWNISLKNVGLFNKKQREYLHYHRNNILKQEN